MTVRGFSVRRFFYKTKSPRYGMIYLQTESRSLCIGSRTTGTDDLPKGAWGSAVTYSAAVCGWYGTYRISFD